MKAARYLHVPPWELDQAPVMWLEAALHTMHIDNDVAEQRDKQRK